MTRMLATSLLLLAAACSIEGTSDATPTDTSGTSTVDTDYTTITLPPDDGTTDAMSPDPITPGPPAAEGCGEGRALGLLLLPWLPLLSLARRRR